MTKKLSTRIRSKRIYFVAIVSVSLLLVSLLTLAAIWQKAQSQKDLGACTTWENKQICAGDFIGRSEADAIKIAENYDIPYRVIQRGNQNFDISFDERPNRVNFTVADGVVIMAEFY